MAQETKPEVKTRFRFRYRLMGGHIHIRVFAVMDKDVNVVKAENIGNLIMSEDQFKEFKAENRELEFFDEEAPGVTR